MSGAETLVRHHGHQHMKALPSSCPGCLLVGRVQPLCVAIDKLGNPLGGVHTKGRYPPLRRMDGEGLAGGWLGWGLAGSWLGGVIGGGGGKL